VPVGTFILCRGSVKTIFSREKSFPLRLNISPRREQLVGISTKNQEQTVVKTVI